MIKFSITTLLVTVSILSSIFVLGCSNDAQTGGLIGAGVGAGIGQLVGGNTEATLIGGAIGGGAGYIIGNESDKKKAAQSKETATNTAVANTETVWVTNTNNSKMQIKLTKQGTGYVGPKGEYYDHLPTSEELRPVYGF